MPAGIEVEVDGGFATLAFLNPALRGPALAELVEIGGGESIEVITRDGPRKKYRVPLGNATTAGLIDGSAQVPPNDSAGQDTGSAARLAGAEHTGPYPFPTSRNKWSTGDAAEPGYVPTPESFEDRNPTPDLSWKLDALRAYARDRDIDLDGATTKAAVLAKITAAGGQ